MFLSRTRLACQFKSSLPGACSDAEWQSEERSLYLAELGKDVDEARDALYRFDPALEQESLAHQRCEDLK